MGYTISVPLLKKVNKEAIIEEFDKFPYENEREYVWMNEHADDHSYSVDIKNGIFCSYKTMPMDTQYYIWYFSALMASRFGRKKMCKQVGNKYPYFYYDSKIIYVIPARDEFLFEDFEFDDDFSYKVLQDIDDIYIYRNVDVNDKVALEDAKLFFGDNDVLKMNCQKLLDFVNNIN